MVKLKAMVLISAAFILPSFAWLASLPDPSVDPKEPAIMIATAHKNIDPLYPERTYVKPISNDVWPWRYANGARMAVVSAKSGDPKVKEISSRRRIMSGGQNDR
jgi:hypothetical protein